MSDFDYNRLRGDVKRECLSSVWGAEKDSSPYDKRAVNVTDTGASFGRSTTTTCRSLPSNHRRCAVAQVKPSGSNNAALECW
jgi:hypothetical protein